MNHRLLLSVALLAAVALVIAGCSSKSSSTNGSGGSTTSVKTMDEYRAEADKQITKDNAEAELDKLEKEIDADK